MANPKHLKILKQGADVWNQWRKEHPRIVPRLSGIDFGRADLVGINFRDSDLIGANLSSANLIDADFSFADLIEAYLINADLSNSDLSNADFSNARLNNVQLTNANLSAARLSGANLSGANLFGAILREANLNKADLSGSSLGRTIFADNDLSTAIGLITVLHHAPSHISIDTVYRSNGKIPEVFLRGCGVPDTLITHIPALIASIQPIQFYSCFISYSDKNHLFVERLYADLQAVGIRCWFAPENMKIGESIRTQIDESIRLYDKLLLVLTEDSIESRWVELEVESALDREKELKKTVLYPLRLDDSIMRVNRGWPQLIKNTRHIADFTRWKDHGSYHKAFTRLLRDLSPRPLEIQSNRSESAI